MIDYDKIKQAIELVHKLAEQTCETVEFAMQCYSSCSPDYSYTIYTSGNEYDGDEFDCDGDEFDCIDTFISKLKELIESHQEQKKVTGLTYVDVVENAIKRIERIERFLNLMGDE